MQNSRSNQPGWFDVRKPLPPGRAAALKVLAFLLPVLIWAAASYIPFDAKPYMRVVEPGASSFLTPGMLIKRDAFDQERRSLNDQGLATPTGTPSMPIYLPAPHEVGVALFTAFTTTPARSDAVWLHESLFHSIQIIFWGFALACAIGVPLGVLAGTFDTVSKLVEPFVDFVRYMPAPAFGAVVVAFFGIYDAPKIAIIFIGTFFQMVLVVANTTRLLDIALIEAAQTLGASRISLLMRVIIPGILPKLYDDLRILLGWAWTYLIVAELIGAASGISYFINQQGRFSQYQNVYAGIVLIGLIGFATDQLLMRIKPYLMPWIPGGRALFRQKSSPTSVNEAKA
ncbi:MAG: ABC transporter permease [Ahrensia sp.]|nr:ABC transporter permease [Ahrensia sp.]